MSNEAVNKVIFGDDTLIDLTSDSVTAADVLAGVTFHDAAGVQQVGTLNIADCFQSVSGSKDNVSISGSATTTIEFNISIPSGYRVISVGAFRVNNASSSGTNASTVMCYGLTCSSTGAVDFRARNISSNAAKVKVTVWALCVRES